MIKVTSKEQAWEEANKLFPTDYAKDEQSSKNAGYPVYRSTAADHYYDYICDLGSRLEVNLSTGETVNIWIEDSQEVKDLRAEVESLKKQLCSLKTALEDELEWKAYESVHNVRQADYVRLAKSIPNGAHYMTDDEAKDWICSEYDFDRDKITIIHEIDEEEVNRHQQIRKTGFKIDRRPIYCASDYHYIRFNTSHWYYEVCDGSLRPFYC